MSTQYSASIKDMPEDERPRERLERYGADNLSNTELLAILIGSGRPGRSALAIADDLMRTFNGLKGTLSKSTSELQQVKGVGQVKAIEIAAAVTLGRRLMSVAADDPTRISNPTDVANLLMSEMRDLVQEHLRVLVLDAKNKVKKVHDVTIGTADASIAIPRDIFRPAITEGGVAIILVHNHPSGDPTPSQEDRQVTARVVEAGKLIGIDVLDHIVIGHNKFVSLKERGLM